MRAILLFWISIFCLLQGFSQNQADTNTYRFIKTEGGEIIGKMIRMDENEILVKTKDGRQFNIPQHTISEMILVKDSDFDQYGEYIGEDKFATRYFITTNGLPIKQGEHYVQWNLFGPDLQFGIGKNLGVGIMTSWFGTPIIGTFKKSWEIGSKSQFAVGSLVGYGSWILPDFGGALPFATLSFGDRKQNIAFSGGYGAIWIDSEVEGRALGSIAGMTKVTPNLSFVFDSFIFLPGRTKTVTETSSEYLYNPNTGEYEWQKVTYKYQSRRELVALLLPGLRWHQSEGNAVQFGFAGIIANGESIPVPIPMLQWFRKL